MKTKKLQQYNSFVKYSSLASQMVVTLLLAAWGGQKLDAWLGMPKPYMTVVCMLLGIIATVVWLIRSLNRDNKQN
ncbi:MAG: AtpZ/AtpI family protein [Thermoflexibacter sp.]|nr:AtpZ/AtpI family protein [Thermoflexibacter sp.]